MSSTAPSPPNALTVRGVRTRTVHVPLTFALGTSAAIVSAVPLLLVDVYMEEGIVGHSYLFCYTASGAKAVAAHIAEVGSCKRIAVADRDRARTEWPALSASFTVSRPIPLLAPMIRTVLIGSKLPDQPARRSGLMLGRAFLVCGAEIVVGELNRRSETACSG